MESYEILLFAGGEGLSDGNHYTLLNIFWRLFGYFW